MKTSDERVTSTETRSIARFGETWAHRLGLNSPDAVALGTGEAG